MSAESEDTPDAGPALQQVLEYHEITKHHVQGYARGPGYLDWATQRGVRALSRPAVTLEWSAWVVTRGRVFHQEGPFEFLDTPRARA